MVQALLAYLLVALAAAWIVWRLSPLKRIVAQLRRSPAKAAGPDCGCDGSCEG